MRAVKFYPLHRALLQALPDMPNTTNVYTLITNPVNSLDSWGYGHRCWGELWSDAVGVSPRLQKAVFDIRAGPNFVHAVIPSMTSLHSYGLLHECGRSVDSDPGAEINQVKIIVRDVYITNDLARRRIPDAESVAAGFDRPCGPAQPDHGKNCRGECRIIRTARCQIY
jgi:hypothetical protein